MWISVKKVFQLHLKNKNKGLGVEQTEATPTWLTGRYKKVWMGNEVWNVIVCLKMCVVFVYLFIYLVIYFYFSFNQGRA